MHQHAANKRVLVLPLTVMVLSQGLGRRRRNLSRTSSDCTPGAKDWPKLDNLLEFALVNGLLHMVCGDDNERSIRAIHCRESLQRFIRCHASHFWHVTAFRHVLFARAR